MTLMISLSLFISFSMSIILTSSPISMGIWVLFLALITALMSSIMLNKWMSFLIFLIYIGGLLVMFAYFAAISPNQQLNIMTLFFNLASTFILLGILLINIPIFFSMSFLTNNSQPLIQLMFSPNMMILLFLALILFFALVAVVKIASITKGPLRPFFYV